MVLKMFVIENKFTFTLLNISKKYDWKVKLYGTVKRGMQHYPSLLHLVDGIVACSIKAKLPATLLTCTYLPHETFTELAH